MCVPKFEILSEKCKRGAYFRNQLKPFITALPLVFPFNLERQGGYQFASAHRVVIAVWVTKSNLFTSFFNQNQNLISAEWEYFWERKTRPLWVATYTNHKLQAQRKNCLKSEENTSLIVLACGYNEHRHAIKSHWPPRDRTPYQSVHSSKRCLKWAQHFHTVTVTFH